MWRWACWCSWPRRRPLPSTVRVCPALPRVGGVASRARRESSRAQTCVRHGTGRCRGDHRGLEADAPRCPARWVRALRQAGSSRAPWCKGSSSSEFVSAAGGGVTDGNNSWSQASRQRVTPSGAVGLAQSNIGTISCSQALPAAGDVVWRRRISWAYSPVCRSCATLPSVRGLFVGGGGGASCSTSAGTGAGGSGSSAGAGSVCSVSLVTASSAARSGSTHTEVSGTGLTGLGDLCGGGCSTCRGGCAGAGGGVGLRGGEGVCGGMGSKLYAAAAT